jgi:N-acyl amino acid synthase of PEP-CTERM/exosortase system
MFLASRHDTATTGDGHGRALVDVYKEIFEVVSADTTSLRDECYRIRHQVYCVENPFLPIADPTDDREIDQFDARARHGLLRFRKTGASLGTIRLVLPDVGKGAAALPMYQVCAEAGLPSSSLPPAAKTAEISRFAIAKQFRQRVGDTLYGRVYQRAELARDDRRVIPHMTLGLMGLALRMSRDAGVGTVCAIMEPTLIRLLGRVGVHWEAVGPLVEYHGLRQPCFAHIEDLLAHIEAERPEVWEVITDTGGQQNARQVIDDQHIA